MRPAALKFLPAALLAAPVLAGDLRQMQIEDLEFVRTHYVGQSLAFSPAGRRRALACIGRLERRAGRLTPAEFLVAMDELAAFADNGHDTAHPGAGAWAPERRLPLRLIWFPDAMIVARAAPEYVDLLGARVERIEGRTPPALLRALRRVRSGTDGNRRWTTLWNIENPDVLQATGLASSPEGLRFDFVLPDSRRVERRITARPLAELPPAMRRSRYWSAEPYGKEAELGWRSATAALPVPLALAEPDRLYRMAPLPGSDALYVQLRSNVDEDGQQIAPFVEALRARLREHPPRHLVLDLRFDAGGDIGTTRELMRDIARTVPDRIYVLIGPSTFSAGIVSAAALKHDGGPKVIIVGESAGDRLQWWSEGESECLPHSKLCLQATTGFWDLLHGCAGRQACYGDQFDARVDGLDPDIPAPFTAAAWLAGRDPALEVVRRDLDACVAAQVSTCSRSQARERQRTSSIRPSSMM